MLDLLIYALKHFSFQFMDCLLKVPFVIVKKLDNNIIELLHLILPIQ